MVQTIGLVKQNRKISHSCKFQLFKINSYLDSPSPYGNILTFPIAYYHLDVTIMECDAEGKIYMSGDFPALISTDFKEGIEKVIMEDYSDTLQWNPKKKIWIEEY